MRQILILIMFLSITIPLFGCADINRDGTIDNEDLAILSENWLKHTQVPAIEMLLDFWYEDYNKGQNLDYLTAEYFHDPNGDPRHYLAVDHEFFQDVQYGPFPRNVLDFWMVKNAPEPTPVAVYIHGGGFVLGDKDSVHNDLNLINNYLASGISVASINYRLKCATVELALDAKIPNNTGTDPQLNGCRLDYILRDCARSIQFLRYKTAEWNIDKNKIAAWGESAGAGASMWIGTIPDLADPNHIDPVLRESSRLLAVGHSNSQGTYNFSRWPEYLQMSPDYVFSHIGDNDIELMQMTRSEMTETLIGRQLSEILDYYEHITPDDCLVITVNQNPDLDEEDTPTESQIIHHPRGHTFIYNRMQELNMQCEIDTVIIQDSSHNGDIQAFFMDLLTGN